MAVCNSSEFVKVSSRRFNLQLLAPIGALQHGAICWQFRRTLKTDQRCKAAEDGNRKSNIHEDKLEARGRSANRSKRPSSENTENTKGKNSGGPISWRALVALLLAGGLAVAWIRTEKDKKETEIRKKKSRTIGIDALGGKFTLTDHTGKERTDESFLGQWIIIYFGFTYCPDICPDELEKLTKAIDIIDNTKNIPYKLQPLFVSVDPDRDTVEQMAEYIKDFHPRLIGLTGTRDQVDRITKAYRVYYSFGPKDSDDDYIVDHSIIMYLVDPDGNFKEYYGQNRPAEEIAASVVNHMLRYKLTSG